MNFISRYFLDILNRPPATPLVPSFDEQLALPKLIHQTFPTKLLPPELQATVDALRGLNPTWRHELYDDTDVARFIRSAYGDEVYARFERIDPIYGAARADLFRYLLLYKQGGVYLDIKSAALVPLDVALRPDERFVVGQWPVGPNANLLNAGWHEETSHIADGEFQQWFIVATPGHPFLKAVIENVLRNIVVYNPALHGVGKKGVLRVTGPIAYTLAIEPLLNRHPHRRADAESDLGFAYSIYRNLEKGDNPHVRHFKTHYSHGTASVVRLAGFNAALAGPLIAAKRLTNLLRGKASLPS